METIRDVIRVKRALKKLLKRSSALFDEYGPEPLPGSKAHSEQLIYLRNISLQTPIRSADLLIESCGDHIFAFCRVITQPAMAMAPWTCIRCALESSAVAAWLLDPNIDGPERLKRSFAYRYYGLDELRKFFASIGDETREKKTEKRISDVEKDAIRFGFDMLKHEKGKRKGKRKGIAQVMPSRTNLIRDVLNKESLYRRTSAMAHGQNWAIMAFSFKPTNNKNVLEKSLSPRSVIDLSVEAVYCFSFALWRKALLFGWDQEKLIFAFDSVWRSCRIGKNEHEFWK